MTVKPGTHLGPYEVLDTLGIGGMGEVYRARDNRLGREVAVKVLPQHLAADSEALGRFEREARTLAALSHPSILTLFDFGEESGIVYAVMELLEGDTLRTLMNQGPVPVEKVLEVGIAVSDGLAAAHSRGIIHRDLKPENIFITADGRVKILDFGLVRWSRAPQSGPVTEMPTGPLDTKTGLVMGTVHYMSPEQVRGLTVDERADLFSLGIVLYEMLHGVRPFAEETMAETMVAILKKDPARSSGRGTIPPDLERVVRSCLEKDPARRIPGARELLVALKEIAGGTTLTISLPKSGPRRVRRKKVIDSVAILPFTHVDVDAEAEYLADGITETIINLLSQIPKLRVMARSTVFLYKDKISDPRSIGRELNVRGVLTGRLLFRNEKLNVQVELVDTEDGSQLWGEQYNQQICDIQSVQQDIAREISERLKIRLVGEDRRRLQKRYTESVQAYRLYLQGRFHWNKRTEDDLQKGIQFFNKAIEEDPGFALAYAGISDTYSVLAGFYLMHPSEAYPRARDAALRALQMDPSMGEAYCSLATVKERYDWDWEGADTDFRRALKLSPGYATAHHWYATYLVMMGKFREAEKAIAKARELDPLSVAMHWSSGYVYYYSRKYDKAVEFYRAALDLDPSFHRARYDMGLTTYMMGKKEEGLRILDQWEAEAPDLHGLLPLRGYYHAISGRPDKAREMIQRIEQLPEDKYVSRFSLAVIFLTLGETETAFSCLQKSLQNHEDALASLRVNPRLDSIRSDPRFIEILTATRLA